MVVDRRYVVVGSYNLDPRSADINTELALLVDSPEFAEMVAEFFEDGIKPENSYRVTLEQGRLRWTSSGDGGTVRVYTKGPRPAGGCASRPMRIRCCEAGRPPRFP